MNKYAVLIGNGEFPNEPNKKYLPNLLGAKNDIDRLKEVLIDCEDGFLEENIIRLIDKTKQDIERAIEETFKKAKSDDLILIHYSGHGFLASSSDRLSLASFDTMYETPVSTAVSTASIRHIMDNHPHLRSIVLILDCCYSSYAAKDITARGNTTKERYKSTPKTLAEIGKGIYLLASATNTAIENKEHGIFSKHLIEGLKTGEADTDNDNYIGVDELFEYILTKVKEERPEQKPEKFIFKAGKKLVLVKSPKETRKKRAEKIRRLLLDFELENPSIYEIKQAAYFIAQKPISKLSSIEKQKDDLCTKLLDERLDIIEFNDLWRSLKTTPARNNFLKSLLFLSLLSIFFILNKDVFLSLSDTPQDIQKPPISIKHKRFKLQDGVAIDTQTNLMWLRFAHGQTWDKSTAKGKAKRVKWEAALNIAQEYNEKGGYGGYTDWRLPTIEELKTLINQKEVDKAKGETGNYIIDTEVFPNNEDWFWSSTFSRTTSSITREPYQVIVKVNKHKKIITKYKEKILKLNYAWFVSFKTGFLLDNGSTTNADYAVRFVRGGQ